MNLSAVVMDSAGHQLPYQVQYDEQSRSVQAELPDGSYTLLVSRIPQAERRGDQGNLNAGVLAGMVDVTVAGHAVPNLRVPLVGSKAESCAVQRACAIAAALWPRQGSRC